MCSVFIIHLYSRYKSHSVLARRCVVAFLFRYYCNTAQFKTQSPPSASFSSASDPTSRHFATDVRSRGLMEHGLVRQGAGKWWWWWADDGGREKTSGWVNGGGGFGDGWRGGRVVWSRQQYRASCWNEPKDPLFFIFVFVCLDAGLYCLVCVIVSFCFVLFCWVGLLCACFIYYLFTAHSIFTSSSKKLIPQGLFSRLQRFHMSDSNC